MISIQENNLLLKLMVPDLLNDEKIFVLGFQNSEWIRYGLIRFFASPIEVSKGS